MTSIQNPRPSGRGGHQSAGKIVGARYDGGRVFLCIELSDPAVSEALAADARKGLSIGG